MAESKKSKALAEGVNIAVTSGVSLFTKKPFVTIFVDGKARGQLTPDEVRGMALQWLEVAAAAEADALVLAELMDGAGADAEVAGHFLVALRDRRDAWQHPKE